MDLKLLRRKGFWAALVLLLFVGYAVYVFVYLATPLGCRGLSWPGRGAVPDRQLEAALKRAVGKPKGPLSPTDLQTVTELHASSEHKLRLGLNGMRVCGGISDLTGLERAVNLTTLRLGTNEIRDLRALSLLTKLTALDLHFNQVSDISPLSTLHDLTWLELSSNEIVDVSSLASLVNLTTLRLSGNKIDDISPLSSLDSLTSLSLNSSRIRDVAPLGFLTNVQYLHLERNQIEDISALRALVNLKSLDLGDNQVLDISPLVDNVGLGQGSRMRLEHNKLDLSPGSKAMQDIATLKARGVSVQY